MDTSTEVIGAIRVCIGVDKDSIWVDFACPWDTKEIREFGLHGCFL
jgi:hypothetical protein